MAEPPEGTTLTSGVVYNPRFMQPVPAWGAYVRHAKDVELHNVQFGFGGSSTRPAVFARDVDGLTFDTFTAMKGGGPELTLDSIMNLVIMASPPLTDGTTPSVTMMNY